ncbi:unnamed protein product [Caenorhabditis sp. 36 PRJEB53466]|nr:unnamed protein product [Caenorhabditis sp. 36 PRJEB53466]
MDFLLGKFSQSIRKETYRSKIQANKDWTMAQMFEDLEQVIKIEEDLRVCMGPGEESEKTTIEQGQSTFQEPNPNNAFGGGVRQNQDPGCAFCKEGDHQPNDCRNVQSNADRRSILQREDRCFNCCRVGHVIKECTSRMSCDSCQGRHSTAICPTRGKIYATSANQKTTVRKYEAKTEDIKPSDGAVSMNVARVKTKDEEAESASVHQAPSTHLQEKTEGFLPTIRTKARNAETGDWKPITVMVDCGATNTFIRGKTAKDLQLKQLPPDSFPMEIFNAKTKRAKKYERSEIEIGLGNAPILIDALHASRLTGKIIRPRLSNEDREFMIKEEIDPHQDLSDGGNEPDIIIGCDHFGKVVKEMIELPSGLTLWRTIFGFLPMGSAWKKGGRRDPTDPYIKRVYSDRQSGIRERKDFVEHEPGASEAPGLHALPIETVAVGTTDDYGPPDKLQNQNEDDHHVGREGHTQSNSYESVLPHIRHDCSANQPTGDQESTHQITSRETNAVSCNPVNARPSSHHASTITPTRKVTERERLFRTTKLSSHHEEPEENDSAGYQTP